MTPALESLPWQPLAPGYVAHQRVETALAYGVTTLLLSLPLLIPGWWWAAAGVAAVGLAWLAYRVMRQRALVASWGYAESETEIYIRHGLMWRTLRVIPFGRMQMVDVTSGPVERAFGIATAELVTATPHSKARIPGLDPAEAERLRQVFTARGESQQAGL